MLWALLLNEFAFSASLRKRNWPEPWKAFVPDLVVNTTVPWLRPYSALILLTFVLTS